MQLLYHDENGRITQSQSGAMSPDDLDDLRARGFLFVVEPDGVSMTDNYVVDGHLVPRPVAPIAISRTEIPADKRSKVKIAGLPDPCVVEIDGEPVTVVGGLIELTSDMPATYWVVFDSFPFMPWSAEITAT
ncbi:hypothetical protein [Kaistia terrae]|uniref:Hedgehog/Intein (Hint) domain-containing protein n=1 Tax=Kaistia terrae TaxID=537017 RepID=A0ABW0Q4C0_9HYPH|nr:hypothetical protein [Kaistia terrae]MCX5581314.1 hypothetical protein [Kaistia terrae]